MLGAKLLCAYFFFHKLLTVSISSSHSVYTTVKIIVFTSSLALLVPAIYGPSVIGPWTLLMRGVYSR